MHSWQKTFLDNHERRNNKSASQGLMRDQMTINSDRTEYGDGRAEIYDLGLLDARGNITNLLLKGEMFTIRECIRFHADIQSPIFTYTIKDKREPSLQAPTPCLRERIFNR